MNDAYRKTTDSWWLAGQMQAAAAAPGQLPEGQGPAYRRESCIDPQRYPCAGLRFSRVDQKLALQLGRGSLFHSRLPSITTHYSFILACT